jgi:signal peptidase I
MRRLALEIGVLVLAALVALALKLWVVGLYQIPSASMLPRLMPGDYLLVEKWPLALRHETPARGDVVIVRLEDRRDVRRVVGLPGDRVTLRDGRLILNGKPVPRWRVADFLFAPTPAMPCRQPEPQPEGPPLCRMRRLREMPRAQFYDILTAGGGDSGPFSVPAGHLFLLGDNRDRATNMEMLPESALIGRAGMVLFSIDERSRLSHPGGWRSSIRWARIGARH